MRSMRLKIYEGAACIISLYLLLDIVAPVSEEGMVWAIFTLFFALAVVELTHIPRLEPEQKYERGRCIINLVIYLICGVLVLLDSMEFYGINIALGLYFIAIPLNRILLIIFVRKRRNVARLILSCLIFIPMGISIMFIPNDSLMDALVVLAVLVLFRALGRIITISFSEIKLSVLKNIIKKTYATEILFGLLLLIISFSMVFTRIEPENFPSYGDGLWYCFAIVTTIGFGDMSAKGLLCRVLSVILGIYGLLIVALITSIVVNFYMEVRGERTNEEEEEFQARVKARKEEKARKKRIRREEKERIRQLELKYGSEHNGVPEDGQREQGNVEAKEAEDRIESGIRGRSEEGSEETGEGDFDSDFRGE